MKAIFKCFAAFTAALFLTTAPVRPAATKSEIDPESLLPILPGWSQAEEVRSYYPETLFEYIDGAAESYLGYDFQGLAVGQYQKDGGGEASLTVEIYDMGLARNAFGIYATERYPDSRFLDIGVQGYIEDGLLNFLAGRYYVKLMAYPGGPEAESALLAAARSITDKIGDVGGFPPVLRAFPESGLVADSQRFVLKNFLGQSELHCGYLALYRRPEGEFELFIIEARTEDEAEDQFGRLTDPSRVRTDSIPDMGGGRRWQDRYLGRMFAVRIGRYVCGAMKVPEGMTDEIRTDLEEMARRLKRSLP